MVTGNSCSVLPSAEQRHAHHRHTYKMQLKKIYTWRLSDQNMLIKSLSQSGITSNLHQTLIMNLVTSLDSWTPHFRSECFEVRIKAQQKANLDTVFKHFATGASWGSAVSASYCNPLQYDIAPQRYSSEDYFQYFVQTLCIAKWKEH